jgi:hypothetical protein
MGFGDFRSVFLPYCLKRQEDGRYAILNREYKPVGFFTDDFIKYEDYPVLVNLKEMTPAKAAKLSHKGEKNIEAIFLYDDSCVPTKSKANMRAFLERLELLAKLSVV